MHYFYNIDQEKYYETPPQEVFDDVKAKSIEIWNTYDDQFGYASEKIGYVNSVENVRDNMWTIVGRFDNTNMSKLWNKLSDETQDYIKSIQKERV